MSPSARVNRELKAAAIEQVLVQMGHRRVPDDATVRHTAVTESGYGGCSEDTWKLVAWFLETRFPNIA